MILDPAAHESRDQCGLQIRWRQVTILIGTFVLVRSITRRFLEIGYRRNVIHLFLLHIDRSPSLELISKGQDKSKNSVLAPK